MKGIQKISNTTIAVVILTVFFIVPLTSSGQQEPQFTFNPFNHNTVNPGYAGLRDAICVTGIVRQQWVGIEDAPETFLVNGDAPIKLLHGGVSAVVMQDKIGYFKDVYVKLGYSYNTSLINGELGIGLNVGFINKSLDFSKLRPVEPDPTLQGGQESSMFTDLGFGVFYIQPGGLYFGLSASQLLEGSKELGAALQYKLRRHYYGTAGYEFSWIRNPAYVFIPSVFVKYDGTTAQVDLNGIVEYNQKFWGGLTYRFQETAAIMLGINIKDLTIGYAYDVPLSGIGSSGSHEVMVRYCFKLEMEKSRQSYRNTRFL